MRWLHAPGAYNSLTHMALQPGTRLAGYEILGLVGTGGMGEVYRARDPRLARDVAIKVLPADRVADEGRRRRFVQEAQAASALRRCTRVRAQPSARSRVRGPESPDNAALSSTASATVRIHSCPN